MNAASNGDEYQVLVLIETSGNQHYLYKTNNLRENVGASQLTRTVGEWVRELAPDQKGVILATSGKALVRVKEAGLGKRLIADVTRRALKEAPGMQVSGAMVSLGTDAADAIDRVHKRFNRNRETMGSTRVPVLPWAQPCATSGSPAAGFGRKGDKTLPFSAESIAKQRAAPSWSRYIKERLNFHGRVPGAQQFFIAHDIGRLQRFVDETQWLGVVHADGNGLGQIFLDLGTHLANLSRTGASTTTVFETISLISHELQAATENAFFSACEHIHWLGASKAYQSKFRGRASKRIYIPVIPLVLAGDDLTVLVEGEYALPFAKTFLRAFEDETAKCPTIARIAEVALGAPRLSAAAGVALVKHHFPFHLAYSLAEELLKSAKQVKREVPSSVRDGDTPAPFPASALDFHVLFDASYTDLYAIRAHRMTVCGSVGAPENHPEDTDQRLYGGPYVVTPNNRFGKAAETGAAWAAEHHFDALVSRFRALNAEDADTGRARLPSSQMHALRAAVAQGKDYADARLRELRWLNEKGLSVLLEGHDSLFAWRGGKCSTRFVDAINGAGFWPAREDQSVMAGGLAQEDRHE